MWASIPCNNDKDMDCTHGTTHDGEPSSSLPSLEPQSSIDLGTLRDLPEQSRSHDSQVLCGLRSLPGAVKRDSPMVPAPFQLVYK
jgi:hypothetical protein